MPGIPFKTIASFYGGTSSRERLSVDFSGNILKIVHARARAHRYEIADLLSHDISGLSDADISQLIKKYASRLKTKNPDCINIVPSHAVITKNIEIPSTNPQEIRDIINLQAGRHTPYSRDEILIDYIDIGVYKHNYTKILLVIVARNVVKRQFDVLDKAGLRLERVFFAPEGLARSVSRVLKVETKDAPASIIHVDAGSTDFAVVLKDKLIFIRSIPIGARHLTEEKDRFQVKFAEEVKRSLEAYQSEDIERAPAVMILTGALTETRELEAVFAEVLHIPLRSVGYLRNVSLSAEAIKAAGAPAGPRVSFLSVIAPLYVRDELKIDLVPEEIKIKKAIERRGRDLIKTGILVLLIFILIFFMLTSKIYFTGIYLKKLETKYQPLEKEAQAFERNFNRVNMVKGYLDRRGYSLEALAELYDLAFSDLQFSDIRFEEQNARFSVRGTAESMSAVFSFVENMEKSKFFKDVKTKYTTKRKEGDKDVTDFEIAAALVPKSG